MIQVKYLGNLGNKLFQYCFGRILAEELGYRLDAEPLEGFPGTYEPVLGKTVEYGTPFVIEESALPDLSVLLNQPIERRIIVNAYLQDYRYYAPYLGRIRRWLRLSEYDRREFQSGPKSLVLNIRLGDYLKSGWALSPEFFVQFVELLPHQSLVIVTDSPSSNYLRHFDQFQPRIVHTSPLGDFKWLINASRLVISQSSFSWWGAILSNAEVWMPETQNSVWSRRSTVDLRVLDNPKWHVVDAETVPPNHGYLSETVPDTTTRKTGDGEGPNDYLRQKVIDRILAVGSDHLPGFGGTYEGGYRIQQCADEFSRLVCLLAAFEPFESYLEIGIASGGTVRFLNELIEIERCVVIDDGRHPQFPVWQQQNRHFVPNVIEFIGDSHSNEAVDFLRGLGSRFNLVGIDGDHSYEGVKSDWRLVQPYLTKGSLVWFHDILSCEGVARLWRELKCQYSPLLETTQLGIGVLQI